MAATPGALQDRRRPARGQALAAGAAREERWFRFLESRSLAVVYASCVGLLVGIAWVDLITGFEIGLSYFYLLPIAGAAWRGGVRPALVLAVLAAYLWYLAEANGGRVYHNPFAVYWNAGVRYGFFATVAALIGVTRRLIERERTMARCDPMTGLANARQFYAVTERVMDRAREDSSPLTIVYIDIDDFKAVNDRLGHAAGDEVIRAVGARVASVVRPTDLVSRLGGDEFALLLPATPAEAATSVLGRVGDRLRELARENGWPIGFSIGALTTPATGSVDELVGRADALMYEVKRCGKNGLRHEVVADAAAGR